MTESLVIDSVRRRRKLGGVNVRRAALSRQWESGKCIDMPIRSDKSLILHLTLGFRFWKNNVTWKSNRGKDIMEEDAFS